MRKHGDFGTETFCPNSWACRIWFAWLCPLPPLIDVRIDLKQPRTGLWDAACEVGRKLGHDQAEIKRALRLAIQTAQRDFQAVPAEVLVPDALEAVLNGNRACARPAFGHDLTIAVGYPYVIYDPYINAGLLKILQQEGVNIVTQDMLPDRVLNREAKGLPKSLFWYFSNRAVYGGMYFMKTGDKRDDSCHRFCLWA